MTRTDILDQSALEQARLIAAGEVSSEEVVRGYLARIDRANAQLSAFTQVLASSALRDARRRDRARAKLARDSRPPFFGVPVAVKDLNFAKGSFTRMGSRGWRWVYTPFDDLTVARLRQAGFVVLGKTATSEFGAMPVTEPDIHQPTRNPWDLRLTAGGSSGGAASALAAGLVPIVQGSDGAGSIRIPSAFCHLYGIKPSRGRVPDAYGRPDRTSLATVGPIARTVEDAAALLDVMAGICVGTPHWAPIPPSPFAQAALERPPTLRVRFTTASPLVETHPEIDRAVRRVVALLAEQGHHVEEAGPPSGELEEFLPIWQFMVAQVPILRPKMLQPVTAWLRDAGRRLELRAVLARQTELERRVLEWFGEVDLWVTPTVAVPPPPVGAWSALPPAEAFRRAATLGAFTALFNITGQPAANIPAGFSQEGWPIGVQLAGRPLHDATVLAASRQLERVLEWDALRPSLTPAQVTPESTDRQTGEHAGRDLKHP